MTDSEIEVLISVAERPAGDIWQPSCNINRLCDMTSNEFYIWPLWTDLVARFSSQFVFTAVAAGAMAARRRLLTSHHWKTRRDAEDLNVSPRLDSKWSEHGSSRVTFFKFKFTLNDINEWYRLKCYVSVCTQRSSECALCKRINIHTRTGATSEPSLAESKVSDDDRTLSTRAAA